MKKIVILISGRGSNMQAIVQAAKTEQWAAQIAAVISNRADASGLEYAASMGIPAIVVPSKNFTSRDAFDAELKRVIDKFSPDLVVLAGFMRILTASFVEHYMGRMINIHPSLLPSFVGLATHQQALDAGVKIHGVTVHFVTPELDHGPIIDQAVIPVFYDDTVDSLSHRALEQEHIIYPRAVKWFIDDKLSIVGQRVRVELH
ncbi:phosphoribosylglycinamide formyltransferase [Undibacterium sp. RuTC16W]|uniref:phosphoribosylglycinamide formyltransferase n=1 Tax=Undibacterium sp. RuTC16W TaxID=3413048 RepID=UPI003BF1BD1F